MRLRRGDIWLADLGEPRGNAPAYHRPVLVVQDNHFNDSRLATVIVVSLTSNQALAACPGNVVLSAAESGLDRDSVINITQLVTIDKDDLIDQVGAVAQATLEHIAHGLAMILGLD